jgi:putative drug exporter of the RND superfamily
MMAPIARWCYGHRFVVLGIWLPALVDLAVLNAVGNGYNDISRCLGRVGAGVESVAAGVPVRAGESDTIV